MPEWFTPLLRVLVAIPSFGNRSTRKTSCQRSETARAIAHPITPPPIIRMLAWSMNSGYRKMVRLEIRTLEASRFCLQRPQKLLIAADGIKERIAGHQPRLRPVVHRIRSLLVRLISIPPQRGRSMQAILVDGIEINMKRRELLLVVLVVARNACHRFEASVGRRFPLPHHFNNGMPAGNLDVFLALARRARRAHFIVHAAARANNR